MISSGGVALGLGGSGQVQEINGEKEVENHRGQHARRGIF